jgi:CrcB protein
VYSKLFFVFLGGGIGSVLRYGTNTIVNLYVIGQLGTIVVNVLGSFLFGILVSIEEQRSDYFNFFLLTGLLGGYTTFSQFSFDVLTLQNNGNLYSILYILSSVLLSISMALLGINIANRFINS